MSIQILIGALLIGDVPHKKDCVYGDAIVDNNNRLSVTRDGFAITPPVTTAPTATVSSFTKFSRVALSRMIAPVHCRHSVRHTMMPPGI